MSISDGGVVGELARLRVFWHAAMRYKDAG